MRQMDQILFYGILGVVGVVAFGLTLLLGRITLPILRAKKAGQPISEFLVSHQSKAGTPTMGGIVFIPSFLVAILGFMLYVVLAYGWDTPLISVALVSLYGLAHAAIGLVDDSIKLLRRHNQGLTEKQKLWLQVLAAAAFVAMMAITGQLTTALHIPFTDLSWELSWFSYPLYILVMVGFVNATNITDGLDGLASSICATVALFVVALAVWSRGATSDGTAAEVVGVMGAALLGCVLGFLVYNRHPAKMFMGDTGSLFLGAILMGCAVTMGELLLFLLAGLMFVVEMLSSLLQILCYKLTKKRIFKKAPLHHHFEECGWRETGIVTVFTLISLLFCLLAWLGK